ncbi:MAG: hypothetical protein C0469_17385 [Cyanobacteria bacterium DS2.3.42]|nr:hypothetical protein [Cyanobacteria bacterium DS2.3.42]
MFAPAYAQNEHGTELGSKYNPIKIAGLNIPYFGGGPEEEKVRTTVFKKQISLLRTANKLRPSVEDYLIALNVQLLYLQRFSDYRRHWRVTFSKQEDPRALDAANGYVEKGFRDECLKTLHYAEDVQDLLGSELFTQVLAINPYSRVMPIALQNVKDFKQRGPESQGGLDYKQSLWRPLRDSKQTKQLRPLRDASASEEFDGVLDKTSKRFAIKEFSQSELEQHFKEQNEFMEREKEVKQLRYRKGEKVMPWEDLLPYGSREWNQRN